MLNEFVMRELGSLCVVSVICSQCLTSNEVVCDLWYEKEEKIGREKLRGEIYIQNGLPTSSYMARHTDSPLPCTLTNKISARIRSSVVNDVTGHIPCSVLYTRVPP
jgi:hypothetical protein